MCSLVSVQVFINRCLRSIFRNYWPNRITNEELLRRAEIEPAEIRIRRQKCAWIGHTLRKDEDSMAMEWNPFDYLGRASGGQCQTWRRAVERETKTLGKKLARAEINIKKPHTKESRHCWCPMSQRGLRTTTRKRKRRSWYPYFELESLLFLHKQLWTSAKILNFIINLIKPCDCPETFRKFSNLLKFEEFIHRLKLKFW